MKKLFYLLLILPIAFSSCKKDEDDNGGSNTVQGCMDPNAENYNANATEDDGSCLYDLVGAWETTSAVLDGDPLDLTGIVDVTFLMSNDSIGSITMLTDGTITGATAGIITSFTAGDPNVISYSGTALDAQNPDGYTFTGTVHIDKLTDANNMTWRFQNLTGTGAPSFDTYVKTLVRSSTWSVDDWMMPNLTNE